MSTPPTLAQLVDAMEAIAPTAFAEPWDNVGLLVQPLSAEGDDPWGSRPITRALVTIDLTEPVLEEAFAHDVQVIISYHPPIFEGLKRLTAAEPMDRALLRAIAGGVAIYAPHTALDAAPGGLAEWLLLGVGPMTDVAPIAALEDAPHAGPGRQGTLAAPTGLAALVDTVKRHLGLEAVRLAASRPHLAGADVRTVAVCPGAGGGLFAGLGGVDLLVTGEMRHHDVLARVASGTSVILTDHSHSERGYLPVLAARLGEALGGGVQVRVSEVDADPLQIL